jgi:hypothetical protein
VRDRAYGSALPLDFAVDLSPFANDSRDELIAKARALGVDRPELMTRVELADEIVRRTAPDTVEQKRARGWLGVARDLVASVVESGLNLPDAAAVIRGERESLELKTPEPVATVTLAEIYAAQGHTERALAMLDDVLVSEPDHEAARRLREQLLGDRGPRPERPSPRAAPLPDLPASLDALPSVDDEGHDTIAPEPASYVEADSEPAYVPSEPAAVYVPAEPEPMYIEPDPETIAPAPDLPTIPPAPDPPTIAPERVYLTPAAVYVPAEPEPMYIEPEAVRIVPEPNAASPAPVAVPGPDPSASLGFPTLILLRPPASDPVVCWELGATPSPGIPLQVVCIAFKSAAGAVERSELTIPVTDRRGRAVLESLEPGAFVRAALGFEDETGFFPLAIASEIEATGGDVRVRYRPPGAREAPPTETERSLACEFAG